jgi:single-stranded-DNA-specific exonuclease
MKYRWLTALDQPLLAARLASELRISPLLSQCLVNRNLDDPRIIGSFLEPRLKALADPFLIPNMATAVERLLAAREKNEGLVIFGDYDVDGVVSTALLLEFLRTLGWQVDCYLPHRLSEGYGLTLESAERCLKKTPTALVLAVDCGSNATTCIATLQQKNIDVLVLDHHQVPSPPPPALALVNPRLTTTHERRDPTEPGRTPPPIQCFTELCSAGLAFKLAHALIKRGRQIGLPGASEYDLRPLLDLVALGTIADLVPLTGENRILVSTGLERLSRTDRPGLIALKTVARSPASLSVHEVGYQLAPRLNAAGRLETAETALNLILARTLDEARPLAEALDQQNRERQGVERAIAEEAVRLIRQRFRPEEDFVIVEGQMNWHVGVVGIVASRVLHQFNRPAIIIGSDGSEWRGSGRSVAGFDLATALAQCNDLLLRHGGHAMAAGLTIAQENLGQFRVRLNELARRGLTLEQLQPLLHLDAEVALNQISFECLGQLDRLNPIGQGNPPVQLFSRNVRHGRPLQRMGAEKQHVKMWVTDGAVTHEAVWWGAGQESLPVGEYDLAFSPQINDYKGSRSLQLKVLDWRPSQLGTSRTTN